MLDTPRRLTKGQFLKDLERLATGFRATIEAEVSGFSASPQDSKERRARAQDDFEWFARTYFPHYVRFSNSALHDYIYRRLPEIAASPESESEAIAAPRGEAKSTLTSQIFVLWCVCTGRKWYPIIGMDAFEQSATMLEAIKAELESNPRLMMDFADVCGQGPVWKAGVVVTRNNRKIEAVGTGKRIRGRRHGPHRPDLFIGDDLENDENVKSAEQRDKTETWVTKAVLKLGGAGEKFDCILIGTVLHYDSALSRFLANPMWSGQRFQALIRWPDRMDLWERWENLWKGDGRAAAEAFWAEHHEAMELGAVVSWPSGRPLLALMTIRARDGHAAFDSELQNDPLNDQDAPFRALAYWTEDDPEWVFVGAVDPSLGKAGNSRDPSAILIGGYNRRTGVLDVIEASITKRLPDRIISDVIEMHRRTPCLVWVVESVQFQEFFRTELVKRSAAAGVPVPAVPITPATDKALRIESLQPHTANGLIRFRPDQRVLLDQLRHWPKADHDDGPDCLHMLWAAAVSRLGAVPRVTTRKIAGRERRFEGY